MNKQTRWANHPLVIWTFPACSYINMVCHTLQALESPSVEQNTTSPRLQRDQNKAVTATQLLRTLSIMSARTLSNPFSPSTEEIWRDFDSWWPKPPSMYSVCLLTSGLIVSSPPDWHVSEQWKKKQYGVNVRRVRPECEIKAELTGLLFHRSYILEKKH